ncbi:MAG: CBS domain-containing protein [Gammaproteobacteria bacterium]|nr:CBS domain-containing protein [Gammaproteobacteria bacterium]
MYDWKAVVLRPEDTMENAIQALDREALRIVLVADTKGRLLGTITDGDIRRALIKHFGMDANLDEVMNKEPTIAQVKDGREAILAMMKEKDLLHMPIVDDAGCIVSLETLQHLIKSKKLDNPVFLMAGGFGKRLRPLTNDVPKPLLKVGSKPILEKILNQFIEKGFHNFFISTHYKAEMVREHFGDGGRWDVDIRYVHENEPLGTAGALGLLPDDLPDLPIMMMNGDLLTEVNIERLLEFHNARGGIATMCVREYDFQVPYGVIEAKDGVIKGVIEKPVHKFFVNAGIYVLSQDLVKSVDGTRYLDMPHLLDESIRSGSQVNSFPIHEYWLDIGRMEEFERANRDTCV